MNGVLMNSGTAWNNSFLITAYEPKDLSGVEITYEIDRLEHYSGGKMDGYAPNVRFSFTTEVEESEKPHILPTVLDYDGTQDLAFILKDGIGDHAIKDITRVSVYSGLEFWFTDSNSFTYDVDAGTLTLRRLVINNILNDLQDHHNQLGGYLWI